MAIGMWATKMSLLTATNDSPDNAREPATITALMIIAPAPAMAVITIANRPELLRKAGLARAPIITAGTAMFSVLTPRVVRPPN